MADWRDAGGEQKTELTPSAIFVERRIARPRGGLTPWFTSMGERAGATFPGEVMGIHLDSARIRIYSEDRGPSDSRKNADIEERAKRIYQPGMGMRRQTFSKYFAGATKK